MGSVGSGRYSDRSGSYTRRLSVHSTPSSLTHLPTPSFRTYLQVSRRLSTMCNGNVMDGEGRDEGSVVLKDEVDGVCIRIMQQIGKGGERL